MLDTTLVVSTLGVSSCGVGALLNGVPGTNMFFSFCFAPGITLSKKVGLVLIVPLSSYINLPFASFIAFASAGS